MHRFSLRAALALLPRMLLAELLVLACVVQAWGIATTFVGAVDLQIPLGAAQRWMDGGAPYLASAFSQPIGPNLPYLYPPFLLPLFAPFLALPRVPLYVAWDLACATLALVAIHRLAVPRRWWPVLLLWAPMAEAIWNGNLQVALFAAFCCAFWRRPGPSGTRNPRELAAGMVGTGNAILAGIVAAIKASQVHAWLLVARWDTRAAVRGAAVLAVLVAATLPLTGVSIYADWLAQLARAADPSWPATGWSLSTVLPPMAWIAVLGGSLLAVLALPRRDAAIWVALLLTLATPTLRNYSWMFCLPAMLEIRLELALLVALAFVTYNAPLEWIAFGVLSIAFLASYRWPFLRAVRDPHGAPQREPAPVTP